MNILLWVVQVLTAAGCTNGAVYRFMNWKQMEKMASIKALPRGIWSAINVFEIVCSLGLILPGIFHFMPNLTAIAAACLAAEMLLLTGLHVRHFGFKYKATNPAAWSLTFAVLSAFVAFGRFVILPT